MNAEIRPIRTAAETALAEAFAVADAILPGSESIRRARQHAFDVVLSHGLPHRRIEAWKYTDLRANLRNLAPAALRPDAEAVEAARALLPFADLDADRIVLVNGYVVPELSSPRLGADIVATRLADAVGEDALALPQFRDSDFIRACNTAFAADGIAIRVAAGARPARPIHIASLHVGAPAMAHVRIELSVGADADITVFETQSGDAAAHQATTVVELDIGARAKVTHIRLQDLGLSAISLSAVDARLGAGCVFDPISIAVGCALARQEIGIDFAEPKSILGMRSIALAGGRRHLDTTLVAEHSAFGCVSRELFKTVLDGEAHAIFQGKIVVHPLAQKTDGKMMARALMLAEGPEADMKPELEIYADDVVCGHGATAGQIDEELLFYLRSRGIDPATAQALMVQAFLGEVLEGIAHEGLRERLTERTAAWLADRR